MARCESCHADGAMTWRDRVPDEMLERAERELTPKVLDTVLCDDCFRVCALILQALAEAGGNLDRDELQRVLEAKYAGVSR